MEESTQSTGSGREPSDPVDWLEVLYDGAEGLSSEDRAAVAYWDPVFFCRYYLHDLFPSTMPWIHRAVLAILTRRCKFLVKYGELDKILTNFAFKDDDGTILQLFYYTDDGELSMRYRKYTNLMLPRGASKTTIAGIAIPLYEILFQDCDFTAYVSEAGPHAKMQLDTVKKELSYNEKIIEDFGNLRPKQSGDERWSQDMFETNTGVAMLARGRGSQIRGVLFHGRRPGKIICDDLDDKDSVKTEDRRAGTKEWFYGDLIPALPKVMKEGTIVNLATTLHPEALAWVLQRDPQWTNIIFGAYDIDGDLLWPAWMNEADLAREKRSYQIQGLLHVFYMEYHNQIRAAETQIFKQEYIKYGFPTGPIRTAIYCDPAISGKRKANRTFIIVAGMADTGFIYIMEVWAKLGATPRELINKYFELAKRFKCDQVTGHGMESVAYQAALVHLLKEEMFRKNWFFQVTAVTHARKTDKVPTKKEERIQTILQPRYAAGYIYHVRPFPDLETELLDFSLVSSGLDDGPDCEAGVISLLDPFAADASGLVDLAADQYEALEDVFEGEEGRWAC